MHSSSNYFPIRLNSISRKKAMLRSIAIAVPVAISTLYPPFILVPLLVAFAWILHFNITFFQKLRHKTLWQTAFAFALSCSTLLKTVTPAKAAFSFLFQSSEKVLNTCVLAQFAGIATISAILFGAMRVGFMVGIGVAGYKIWQQRGQQQDWQEVLNIMLVAVLIVVIIGFIEPYVVGTGAC